MEDVFIHLIKASVLLAIFHLTYVVFLKKETFFTKNRWFLALGCLTALLLPFFKLTQTVYLDVAPVVNNGMGENIAQTTMPTETWVDQLWFWTAVIYGMVVLALLIKLAVQLLALKRLTGRSEISRETPFYHVKTKNAIAPFSFFNYIYYFPQQFGKNELHSVIAHEKVHAREYHSLDLLLLEVTCILLWFNPIVWFYQKNIKQNLEFLADAKACIGVDKKTYQYLMLKQAMGQNQFALSNAFYNSLIKKRIVMLNQNQSKKMNVLKLLLVVPFLALFLVGFNTHTEYLYNFPQTENEGEIEALAPNEKSIEFIVTKNTTDEQLEKMKEALSEDDIDFSYTVVHNDKKEIIDISINVSGKGKDGASFSSSYNNAKNEGISPLAIFIDLEDGSVSIGTKNKTSDDGLVWVSADDDDTLTEVIIHETKGGNTFVVDDEETDVIEIHEEGSKIFILEDDDDDEIKIEMHGDKGKHKKKFKKIKVSKDGKEDGNVFIMKDTDHDEDVSVISSDGGFFFVDTNGEGEPLYVINGKKSTKKALKKLNPKKIKTVEVLKGKAAKKKYGKDAKNGVIEITTK